MNSKKYPLNHLIIYLLSRCNLKCLFCSGRDDRQKTMEKKRVIKIIDELKNYQIEYIVFTGGEITLYKDLLEIVDYTKKRLGCQIILNTNGVNLNSGIITRLTENGSISLKISLHSFDGDIYDRVTGVPGSYGKLLNNIKKINKINQKNNGELKIKTNTVIFNRNYKNIDKLIDFGYKNNIKDMQFSLANMRDNYKSDDYFDSLNKKQLRELYFEIYPRLLKKAISKKIRVEFRPMFVDLVGLSDHELINRLRPFKKFNQELDNYSKELFGKKFYRKYKCHQAFSGIAIMPEGDVLFCCSNFNNKIGNIFNDSLGKVLLFKKSVQPKGCDKCRLFFSANKEFHKRI